MQTRTVVSSLLALAATTASAAPFLPRDSNPGCSSASLGEFAWTVQNFQYNGSWVFSTPAHQIDSGTVSFQVVNPALEYVALCSAMSTQLQDFFYGTVDYKCTLPDDVTSTSTSTTFSFSYPAQQLNISQTWSCSDADPTYPTRFTYVGSASLPLGCDETSYQNPDWQMGETYSYKYLKCTTGDVAVTPYQKSAVA